MTGEIAFEEASGVTAALAFGDPSRDVVPGRWVVLAAVQDDGVQRPVELPIARAVQPVPGHLARRFWDRVGAGEGRECGFGA